MERLTTGELFELFQEADVMTPVSKIASLTLRAACELQMYHDTGYAPSDIADLRNELCLKCGNYKAAHFGACDHCKWAKATASKQIKEET